MAVVEEVLRRNLVDEVRLLPCRQNPLKGETPAYTTEERLSLLSKAIRYMMDKGRIAEGRVKIDEIELRMPLPSYTYKTMERIAEQNPDVEYSLILGGDSYEAFHLWVNAEWLRDKFRLIVYPRPGHSFASAPRDKNTVILNDIKQYDVSSTRIREALAKGETPVEQMPWCELDDNKI